MENTNSLGLLLSFARPCRRLLAASVGLAVLGVASGMVPYFAVSYMIVDLYAGTATPGSLFLFALIALLGQAGRVALGTASTVLSHRAAFAILKGIRTDIAAKLSRMPLGSVIETPSGKLKTLIVDTVEKMEVPLAHLIPELTSNLLVPLFMAAYLFWLDWRMALLALATFPVGLFCYMAMTKDYAERYATVQDAGKGMNAAIVEYINGIEVIKAFNQSSASYGKFVAAVRANRDAMKDWFRATNGYYVAGMAIAPASLITVLPAGVYFHMSGTLDAPAAITCFILSLGLIQPILQALGYTDSLAMMDSTLKEVSDLLGRPEMVRPSNCVPLRGHGIEFDQVSFAYTGTGREVLQDVSFKIVEGGMTAIVGPSGSGKSTLAKLLVSFWEADRGRILLGGVDVRNLPLSQVMQSVAYVSQDNFLFNVSLRENIRLGRPDATDREVEEAAEAAACGFIKALPGGYDTPAGDAGARLSGGERQRIAIARAMLKDSPIVVLDEATAFADPENEAFIQESISRLVKDKTLVVIAHRLSTIVRADRIVVMDGGRVSAVGTHAELLQTSPLYGRLWESHTGARDAEGAEHD